MIKLNDNQKRLIINIILGVIILFFNIRFLIDFTSVVKTSGFGIAVSVQVFLISLFILFVNYFIRKNK